MTGLPRLYAVLDTEALAARGWAPAAVLEAWLDAGVRLIQLRAKTLPTGAFVALAADVVARTRAAGGQVIINDRADVARIVEADGIHVGQHDLTPADVLRVFPKQGTRPWVGLSTHLVSQVDDALAGPADYLATGPVYPTGSKADADPVVGLAGVTAAATRTRAAGRPLVAIGGITVESAPAVLAAGADAVAVISALLGDDPGTSARAMLAAISAEIPAASRIIAGL